MRVFNKTIATAVPLNTNYNSPASPLKSIYMYDMAANITGTPNGTLKLQASNDPETNDTMPGGVPQPQPTNWADIQNSTFVAVTGTNMWNVRAVGYNYVRVVYTDLSSGSSTATMTIIINGKGW